MLDKLFALIGILGVIAFMGVVTVFVMEPDLWIVTIVVLTIAVIFFLQDLKSSGSHAGGDSQGDTEG